MTPPLGDWIKRFIPDHDPQHFILGYVNGYVVGWSPMDWWQNNWSAPIVSLGYFWTSIWRDGTDAAGPGRSCDAGGRDETCPERHAAAAVGSPSVDWWYWKQARSTHWSKRSCCWTGWARSSTLIHLPWVNIQVLRKQSLGNDKPLGRFRKKVGVLTTKIGSIPGNCCTCSLPESPFWYTSGGRIGIYV